MSTANSLKTVVKNLTAQDQYIAFLPPWGGTIPANGSVMLDNIGSIGDLISAGNRRSPKRMSAEIEALVVAGTIAIIPPAPQVLDTVNGGLYDITSASGTVGTKVPSTEVVAGPPGTPTFGTTAATTQVVNWTAPTDPGTRPILSYIVEWSVHSANSWTQVPSAGTGTTHTVTGLTTATSYDFRVRAVTAEGQGTASGIGTHSTS